MAGTSLLQGASASANSGQNAVVALSSSVGIGDNIVVRVAYQSRVTTPAAPTVSGTGALSAFTKRADSGSLDASVQLVVWDATVTTAGTLTLTVAGTPGKGVVVEEWWGLGAFGGVGTASDVIATTDSPSVASVATGATVLSAVSVASNSGSFSASGATLSTTETSTTLPCIGSSYALNPGAGTQSQTLTWANSGHAVGYALWYQPSGQVCGGETGPNRTVVTSDGTIFLAIGGQGYASTDGGYTWTDVQGFGGFSAIGIGIDGTGGVDYLGSDYNSGIGNSEPFYDRGTYNSGTKSWSFGGKNFIANSGLASDPMQGFVPIRAGGYLWALTPDEAHGTDTTVYTNYATGTSNAPTWTAGPSATCTASERVSTMACAVTVAGQDYLVNVHAPYQTGTVVAEVKKASDASAWSSYTSPNYGISGNPYSYVVCSPDGSGKIMVAWSGSNSGNGVGVARFDPVAGTWDSSATTIGGASDGYPCFALSGTTLYLLWCQYAAASSYALVYKTWNGSAWSGAITTLIAAGDSLAQPGAWASSTTLYYIVQDGTVHSGSNTVLFGQRSIGASGPTDPFPLVYSQIVPKQTVYRL